jgi:hypothetical protein
MHDNTMEKTQFYDDTMKTRWYGGENTMLDDEIAISAANS